MPKQPKVPDEQAFVSTTFEWKRVKITRPRQGERRVAEGGRSRYTLRRRNWFTKLNANLRYSGGPEAWVVVEARGVEFRFPGWTTIVEVMAEVNRR